MRIAQVRELQPSLQSPYNHQRYQEALEFMEANEKDSLEQIEERYREKEKLIHEKNIKS